MIDLYTWTTPNGRKITIMLEELGIPYTVHTIDIGKDEQFAPSFLKIAPNNRIPAIVDHETGVQMMESGAILQYFAEKTGKLLPTDTKKRWAAIEWLNWQMGGPGPMLGQVHHFSFYNKGKSAYSEERYENEAKRLYGVADRRLAENEFIAGDEYTIADIALFPWFARHDRQNVDLKNFPNVKRWYLTVADRPAVQKGYNIPKSDQKMPIPE
ncbi:MAG: glutathione S-transferase family protein [Rhodospirillales bacterium]